MSLTLFLSVIARRLRAKRRREPKRYEVLPRSPRLVTGSEVRLVWVGGKPALRFVNTERDERVRLSQLNAVSFSVINGKPVLRFTGEDVKKQDNREQRYDDVTGRVRLTSASSMKLYSVNGNSYVSMLNN